MFTTLSKWNIQCVALKACWVLSETDQGEYGNFLLLVVLYIMAILKLNANLWLTNSVNKMRLNAFDAILVLFYSLQQVMTHASQDALAILYQVNYKDG